MGEKVLICTVGGSHQPIVKAIESTAPTYICFVCSGRDPETDRPGSIVQITGSGSVIRAHRCDEKPTLPNIPTQVNFAPSRFETVEVWADDLDRTFSAMRSAIVKLRKRFPSARIVADYTGGTKTMTAALVCAALESDAVELQLVAGARPNLERVEDGTESPMTAGVEQIRLDRAMAPCLKAWTRFAYSEAAEGLDEIRIAVSSPDRRRLALARALSRAFARWDDFDHDGARKAVDPFRKQVAADLPWMLPTLGRLLDRDTPKRDAARLFDLWLNAGRRAAQGRYDDAVARVYRTIEWTAQWQLRNELKVDTASFPVELLPVGTHVRSDRHGNAKIGLELAWRSISRNLQGPAQEFSNRYLDEMRDLLRIRNSSILAHGFSPVTEVDWKRISTWMSDRFLPMLCTAAARVGFKGQLRQLPTEPPGSVNRP